MRPGEDESLHSGRESVLPPPFFLSIQTLNKLDGAHPHWGGPLALLSSPIQLLTSSGDTLTDTSRSNVLPAIWASPLA